MGLFDSFGELLGSVEEALPEAIDVAGESTTGIPWGTIATTVAPSLIQGGLGYLGQQGANATNLQSAKAQMDFQERMSNTAYQRAVADMQAAGLNPMLAYSRGPASTPGGASTQVGNALGAGVEAFQKAQSTSSAAELQRAQARMVADQEANLVSQTQLNSANAALSKAQAIKTSAETMNAYGMNAQIKSMTNQLDALANLHGASANQLQTLVKQIVQNMKINEPKERLSQENPDFAKWFSPVMESIGTISGALSPLGRMIPTTSYVAKVPK